MWKYILNNCETANAQRSVWRQRGPGNELWWKYLHSLLAGECCQCHGAPAGLQVFALVDATF